ncbi:MAG: iron ABC transporter permease [Acidobacteriota bacterium]|nr:iron ABC transporter permease [Acidobacteriota bacterium]
MAGKGRTDGAYRRLILVLAVCLLVLTLFSIFIGRYPRAGLSSPRDVLGDDLAIRLVGSLRLPRIIAACLLGAALSAAGAVFQTLFRNPLVDSGFLGVSQGAAFGASLAIVLFGGAAASVQLGAAVFSLVGLAGSYIISRRIRFGGSILRLVLSGIIVASLFSAGTGILKYLADPNKQLPDLTFWMLGGLWSSAWPDVIQILPVTLIALAVIYLMRWRLNLLAMRDETAFSLGASPRPERLILLLAAAAATAAVVCKAGQVSWVGLIIPHIARRLAGSDAQKTVPASMLLGAFFVLACDDISRTLLSGEIPLGILTSIIGTIVFLILLMKERPGARR